MILEFCLKTFFESNFNAKPSADPWKILVSFFSFALTSEFAWFGNFSIQKQFIRNKSLENSRFFTMRASCFSTKKPFYIPINKAQQKISSH